MRTWRERALVCVAWSTTLLAGYAMVARWDPSALGPATEGRAPALGTGEFRVLTMNAWLLSQPHRVRPLIRAIDAEGAALARAEVDRPALVGIEELQSRAAVAELAREMGDDGFFAACECSVRADGSLRSAVAAAVRRPWVVREHECIGLRRMLPDQRRCALMARAEDPDGRALVLVVTHLAWHFANGPMADWLRSSLDARGALGPSTIVVGDLNAWPGSEAHARLARPPLRDTRPGAPPTHFLGWRIDHVLVGGAFEVVRGLDRRASYERIRPAATLLRPPVCGERGPPDCPVSDHLPEGVVLRWRSSARR